jgi:hypothetical protein
VNSPVPGFKRTARSLSIRQPTVSCYCVLTAVLVGSVHLFTNADVPLSQTRFCAFDVPTKLISCTAHSGIPCRGAVVVKVMIPVSAPKLGALTGILNVFASMMVATNVPLIALQLPVAPETLMVRLSSQLGTIGVRPCGRPCGETA